MNDTYNEKMQAAFHEEAEEILVELEENPQKRKPVLKLPGV